MATRPGPTPTGARVETTCRRMNGGAVCAAAGRVALAVSFTRVFTSPLLRASKTCELAGFGVGAEGPHGRLNIEKTHFDPWRRLWGNLHGSPPGRALQAPLGCRDRSGEPGQLSAHDAAAV